MSTRPPATAMARSGASAVRKLWACGLALLICACAAVPASAQYFGQNKVQYRSREWSVLKTKHFHLYFHDGERNAAIDAGRMAERAYDRLSTILRHEIEDPIPVILYASQAEFQQTNVSPSLIGEGTGGFTEFTKRRVTLPLNGSYREFDHVLTHELVHAFQFDILSVNEDRSMGGSSFRYMPPLWFVEGMAEYLSLGGVDPQTEMWLRDGALEGYLTPIPVLDQVGDIRVYRYGQALLAYLGHTYGDQTIGAILDRIPAAHSLDRAFEQVIGMRIDKFSEDWVDAVRKNYLPEVREHSRPDDFAFRLTRADDDLSPMNVTPALSPDGGLLVYFSDRALHNDLYLASALTGKIQRRLVKTERKDDFESLRFYASSPDWSPDGKTIVFVALAGGRDALHLQRVRDGRMLRTIGADLDAMLCPVFSPDGNWIAFCGLKDGRSNLYRVRADGTGLEQLTHERFTAQEPRWSPDGRTLAIVTDRGEGNDPDRLLFSLPQIAVFDLETGETRLLPGQAGRNTDPQFLPDGQRILYISDRSGIANLYLRDLATGEDRRITDILTGVSGVTPMSPALSLSRSGNRAVFSAFSRGTWDLFAIKDPGTLWDKGIVWKAETPGGAGTAQERAPAASAGSVDSLTASAQAGAAGAFAPAPVPVPGDSAAPDSARKTSVAGVPGTKPGAPSDPAAWTAPVSTPGSESARMDSLLQRVEVPGRPDPGGRPGKAPFEESDSLPPPVRIAEVFARKADLPDPASFQVDPYKVRFTPDYVAANGFFGSNVGLAAQSALQFSDVLGDQVILVGANVYGSITDSDLLLEYINLKRRVNWGVSAFQFRNDYYIYSAERTDAYVNQIYRGVNVTVQRPFSRFRRLEWSCQALSVSEDVYRESFAADPSVIRDRGYLFYGAPGMALVTDNAIYGSTGPISGGRTRVSGECGIGDLSYVTGIADIRRYFNLRQSYALAGRLIAASSAGRDPQYFGVGGPYTVRGYPFGRLRETNIALGSLEFRFPLIENLSLGFPLPLSLQGVRGAFFFDAGAGWTEARRFRATSVVDGRRRLRDILASYGVSATVNVGFTILKWDVAWPTDLSRNTGPARGYLSLGLDF